MARVVPRQSLRKLRLRYTGVIRVRIVHARVASAALESASEWMRDSAGAETLILAATRSAADEFARSLDADALLGVRRLTLTQAAAALAARRMAEHELAPATRTATQAIAARVAFTLNRRHQLPYFGPVANTPGFPAALASTLNELRLARISAKAVEQSGAPGGDLARALRLYERELAERNLADLARLLELATAAAGEDESPLTGVPLLLLDPPLDSVSHVDFVAALASRAPAAFATARSGDARTIDALEKALGVKAQAAPACEDGRALARLRTWLFAEGAPPRGVFDESVDLFSAPGEALETVEIARRIRQLAEQGEPFDSMAILVRDAERYQPLIEEAMRRAGIPAYFSRGAARPDPAGRAFLALLACAGEGCSASRFAEYLSLGQAPEADATGAPPARAPEWVPPEDDMFTGAGAAPALEPEPDEPEATIATPIAWEKLLVDAAVIGGRERWFRRLRGLAAEFQKQLQSLGDEEEARRAHIARQSERLATLERFALPLIEDLDALPKRASWGVWLDALAHLAARSLRRPQSVLSLLEELRPMSEVGPVELDEVTGALSERLRFLRREPPQRRYGCVFVGAIEDARGRAFDTVFTPGLAEGLFPRRAFDDPLLLDERRKSISRELRTRSDKAHEERLLLATALGCARRRVIASFPSIDIAQGRPRVPSFYALEVARAIEGRLPALQEFEAKASEKAEARLAWPAPKEPSQAIDDAEYDLAWLVKKRGVRSGAAYLMEVSAPLARSLRARYMRWEKREWQSADGLIRQDAATRAILAKHRLSETAYSPSSLQYFAACPYKFALHAIYGLRQREEAAPLQQMDPLTRGALFHEVQFRFIRHWQRSREYDFNRLLERLDEALDSVQAEYQEELAPAIPRVWATEIEDIRTDLRGWLRKWVDDLSEWTPAHVEFGFGLADNLADKHDPESRPEPVATCGARMRGSIDLIERHRARNVLRVTDYKTGKAPPRGPVHVGGGATLQPLLYALAAEAILNVPVESSRLFYCTQRGMFAQHAIAVNDLGRARFAQALKIIDGAIERGFLPAAPQKDACSMCEYAIVCGPYEERRVQRWKDRAALDELMQLRSLP
jgi:ATP-dependent helicase/nuclease subunit B